MLSHEELRHQFSYNPETGAFFRRIKVGKNTRLGICGTVDAGGYVVKMLRTFVALQGTKE